MRLFVSYTFDTGRGKSDGTAKPNLTRVDSDQIPEQDSVQQVCCYSA